MTPPTLDTQGGPVISPTSDPENGEKWNIRSGDPWGEAINEKIPEMKKSVYAALGRLQPETFKEITDNILTKIHEGKRRGLENGPHVAQVEAYTRLILDNIGEEEFSLKHDKLPQDQTADASEDLIPSEKSLLEGKRRLTIICALVHDIYKKIEPGFLVTHAFQSAREIASGNLFRELFGTHISEQEIEALSLLTARIIETHSSVPYINSNLLDRNVPGTLHEIQHKEDAPSLMFRQLQRNGNNIVHIKMVEPEDIIGKILRMADGLSNYGVFIDLVMGTMEGKTDIQMKYAGFIKIAGLASKNETISERIEEIIKSAKRYIEKNVYEGAPFAESIAKVSIMAMEGLQVYFTQGDGKTTNHLGIYTEEPDDTKAKEAWQTGLSKELEKALADMEVNILSILHTS